MTTTPTDYSKKLQELLRQLFQFDCADLDFGIYRIMNFKRAVLDKFIEKDLIEAVSAELDTGALAEQSDVVEQLKDVAKQICENLGDDAIDGDGNLAAKHSDTKVGRKYLALQARTGGAQSRPALEAAVFNHLYSFFSRYYDAGDFMSKRRYSKKEKYAVPYNGEEVYLHWANKDQYYIKTGEYFADYRFSAPNGVAVHFKIQAADVEKENIKGENRFFIPLAKKAAFDSKTKEIVLPFEYRPLTEQEEVKYGSRNQQEAIIAEALEAVPKHFAKEDAALAALIAERRKTSDGQSVSYFEHHLRQYSRRNTSDFFIHKDLKGFLTRELDFYLKNEVLGLDEMEAAGESRAAGWFQLIHTLRSIGRTIIAFLSQIEDFQKKLFEKRKFVLSTDYVIAFSTLKRILKLSVYEDLVEKNKSYIFDNKQYKQDVASVIADTLKRPAYNIYVNSISWKKKCIVVTYAKRFTDESKLREYLKKNKGSRYSESDEQVRGVLTRCYYVPCQPAGLPLTLSYESLYIDTGFLPPILKDELIGSISQSDALDSLLNGAMICGENYQGLSILLEKYSKRVRCVYLDPPYNTGGDGFLYKDNYQHSSWLSMMFDRLQLMRLFLTNEGSLYSSIDWNESHRLRFLLDIVFGEENFQREIIWNTGENISGFKSLAPNWIRQHDTILFYSNSPNHLAFHKLWEPLDKDEQHGWLDIIGDDKDSIYIEIWKDGRTVFHPVKGIEVKPLGDVWNDIYSFQYSEPRVTESWFFNTQKVENLIRRVLQAATVPNDYVIDPFLGSGTTSAVAHKLGRKWIGIEMADSFNNKCLPRMKSILIGEKRSHLSIDVDWIGGGFFKYQYLESYEDVLNNIAFSDEVGQKALRFDDYLINYMLDWETKGSETFLNVEKMASPFDYKLQVTQDGQTGEKAVDLPETFNYLLGLHVTTRKVYHDKDRRYLVYRGTVDSRQICVIWRTTAGWGKEDFERDKKFVAEQKIAEGADEVFVNSDSVIPGARSLDPVFKARMFAPIAANGGK